MDKVLRRQFIGNIKDVDTTQKQLTLVISDASEDRDGDTVQVSGWKLGNYRKNPVVMWSHDYSQPPVGRSVKTWVENDKLLSTVEFAPTEFAQQLYLLYSQGFLKACSVGFIPLKWERREPKDEQSWAGYNFLEHELLEYSLCSIPSNPNALALARQAGLEVALVEKACSEPAGAAFFDPSLIKWFASPTLKGAISYSSAHPNGTPKADEDEPWDGPAEMAKAEGMMQLKRMCAWMDSEGDPDVKGTYKLPHHKADGTLVFKGCVAVMGRMNQADIPEGDMAGIRAHMKKHYDEFDHEMPMMDSASSSHTRQSDLGDEMDYLKSLLSKVNGIADNLKPLARELAELLQRETGDDTPVSIKAGAVLNRKNKDALKQAQGLIQQVLDSSESAEEEEGDKQLDPKQLAAALYELWPQNGGSN